MLEKVILRSHEQTGQAAFPILLDVAMDPGVELKKWDVVARGLEEVGHAKSAGWLKPTRRAGRMRDERTFSYN